MTISQKQITCYDWNHSYQYCQQILKNNRIPNNPNLLAALLIITKGYGELTNHEIENIIYGKEMVQKLLDNDGTFIYEQFLYGYDISKISAILKHKTLLKQMFELDSIESVLNVMYIFIFNSEQIKALSKLLIDN